MPAKKYAKWEKMGILINHINKAIIMYYVYIIMYT